MEVPIRTIISAEEIQRRVQELGEKITQDYQGCELDVVGVLKGCMMFMSDLTRHIDLPMTCDFLRVSSYGNGQVSSGVVRFDFDVTQPITGKHVLLIEDIIDTGLTMKYLLDNLKARRPASLRVCSLLHKPSNTREEFPIDYLGFTIPNVFVLGYGMDYEGRFRNLPFIGVLETEKTDSSLES
ncbi:MAG: hypoxanthine phosphoribosyltransferase [Planctomycetota bacterium]|nr:MAG: hypoxanthine phosphoribosyltransferase [Planctomycetota bacterium]